MSTYVIRIRKCDNRLEFFLNGHTLWKETYHNNPDLDVVVDITSRLQANPYPNVITVTGWNIPCVPPQPFRNNPWQFKYSIEKDGAIVVDIDKRGPSENLIVDREVLKLEHTLVIGLGLTGDQVATREL